MQQRGHARDVDAITVNHRAGARPRAEAVAILIRDGSVETPKTPTRFRIEAVDGFLAVDAVKINESTGGKDRTGVALARSQLPDFLRSARRPNAE